VTKPRVVVTGLGMVSPLGLDVESTWAAIKAGKSGIRPITSFDVSEYGSQISGSVQNFNPDLYLPAKDSRKVDVFVQYGIAAAKQAWDDANIDLAHINPERVGVAVGSGIGGLPMIEKNHSAVLNVGPRRMSPFFIPGAIINMVSGYISILLNAKGPNISVVTACTTGTHNIGLAARMIQNGEADLMLAGGSEMATSPLGLGGFAAMRALSTRNHEPEKASRPWDRDRDGFVLGDGSGVIVLETLDHAKARGAHIYAELIGFGMSGDAYHMTSPAPNGEGAARAMLHTLADAQIDPSEVDYINAHGTSTPAGDELEAFAVKEVFANSYQRLAMSSTKSMIGHLLGAAGAVEAIFSILAIRDQVAPPTVNLDNPAEGCDGLNLVAHTAQSRDIRVAMSNSFGFGGTNGALLFRKF
jgi:3-oxoacyl-[acyl-carrier-protein] synthase II